MYISQNNNTAYAYSIYKQFRGTLYYTCRSGFPFTVMAEGKKNIATLIGLFRGFLSSWGVNLYIEGFSECILCTRIISHWILTGPGMYGHHSILFHLDTRGNSSRRHKTHVDTKTGTADLSDQSSLVSHNMSVRFFLSGYRILNI